jgi:hypothetical protein
MWRQTTAGRGDVFVDGRIPQGTAPLRRVSRRRPGPSASPGSWRARRLPLVLGSTSHASAAACAGRHALRPCDADPGLMAEADGCPELHGQRPRRRHGDHRQGVASLQYAVPEHEGDAPRGAFDASASSDEHSYPIWHPRSPEHLTAESGQVGDAPRQPPEGAGVPAMCGRGRRSAVNFHVLERQA